MWNVKLTVAVTLLAGLVLCGCQSQVPEAKAGSNKPADAPANTAAADKPDPKVVDQIKETLAAHDKALNEQNVDGVMATYSADPKVVMLGTGAGERFVGTEAIKNAYTEIVKDYDKGSFVPNCDWKDGGADPAGTMAWLAATCNATDTKKGAKREYVLNVTAAVVKESGGWRFVMLHMSNDTGGGPPPDAKKAEAKK
jgi:ketosteroid isomerase-like protein